MTVSLASSPLPERVHLANAALVLPDRTVTGGVVVEDGVIVEVAEGGAVPAGALDCDGDYLLPGLVELHTDNLERHMLPRPSVKVPYPLAILAHDGELASCGITTVFDALRVGTNSEKSTYGVYAREVATDILRMRDEGALRIRHMLHLRAEVCSGTLLDELDSFGPEDRVRLVSLMDHTPGQRQFRDLDKLWEYHSGKYGTSEEDFAQMVERRLAQRAEIGDTHDTAAAAAARRYGAALASHDDTTEEQVGVSAALGIRLAEFPTTVEAAEACRAQGMRIIMGAPNVMRGGSHSGNVSAIDLAARGLLDILSSDYVPSMLLQAAFRLAGIWGDVPRAICTVTANPADAADLPDRGRIKAGCLGDLARVRMMDGVPVVRAVWRGGARVG